MRLSIRHTTHYRFTEPVVHALQRLRLTPKETQGQSIVDWSMDYEHASPELSYEDQHANTVTLVAVEAGAREMKVTCQGEVDTSDHAGVIGHHAGHLPLWSFRGQTALTKPGAEMQRLAARFAQREDRLDMLHELSAAILDAVPYTIGSTGSTTTAEEALIGCEGVCQDHAHIFIGTARLLGVPARYVSGYLMMDDRVDQDATHAWTEAYVGGLGWVGFDVSNGISPDQRYVRVATGRDYRDAAPITGIRFGSNTEELTVEVAVRQQQQQQQQ